MDWNIHVDAFEQRWMLRYLDPGEASWKTMLDSFILYDNKGNVKYPEGRSIILQNLSTREKAAMLTRIPKGATFIKGCLRKFWKMALAPNNRTHGRESRRQSADGTVAPNPHRPWHGHRFSTSTTTSECAVYEYKIRSAPTTISITFVSRVADRGHVRARH